MKEFVLRRLSRSEYLGLHLTLGLLLSISLLGLFLAIAREVTGDTRLVGVDKRLNSAIGGYRDESPIAREIFWRITDLGSEDAMVTLTVCGAVILLFRGRLFLALVWVIVPAIGGLLDQQLKLWFERPRPSIHDAAFHSATNSFPSGHSMGSVVGYGLLAYVLILHLRHRWARLTAVIGLSLLVALIGFSRIYLGAHYPTDVLGGYALGGCWLAICISAVELVRRRPPKVGLETASDLRLAAQSTKSGPQSTP
jgi:undecaprenyl-diphosphatase